MTFEILADKYNIPIKILKCIRGRFDTFGEVYLSRKEHEKFGVTENQMFSYIRKMRRLGILIDYKVCNKEDLRGKKTPGNSYKVSSVITSIQVFVKDAIQKINKFVDGIAVLQILGFVGGKQQGKKFRFKNRKGKLSGMVLFNDSNVIYRHNKKEATSLFNFVKEKENLTPKQAIEWFDINTKVFA